MSAHDHADHEHHGPGYATPQLAREQPPEQFAYVAALYEGTWIDCHYLLPSSTSIWAPIAMGRSFIAPTCRMLGDELHHFGWNACSSACHSQLQRDTMVVPGMRSSRLHIIDISQPRKPADQEHHRGRGDQGEAGPERPAHGPLHARRHRHDLDAR